MADKDETQLVECGRLAFRVEGDYWNCYFAPEQDSMAGAVILGSLRMTIAQTPEMKDAFIDLMRSAFNIAARELVGAEAAAFDTRPAPEHERAGRA